MKYFSQVKKGALPNLQLKKTMGIIKLNNGMPIIISIPSLNPSRQKRLFIVDKVTVIRFSTYLFFFCKVLCEKPKRSCGAAMRGGSPYRFGGEALQNEAVDLAGLERLIKPIRSCGAAKPGARPYRFGGEALQCQIVINVSNKNVVSFFMATLIICLRYCK